MLTILTSSGSSYLFSALEFDVNELFSIIVSVIMSFYVFYLIVRSANFERPLKTLQTSLVGLIFIVALLSRDIFLQHTAVPPALAVIWTVVINIYALGIGVLLIINGLNEGRFSSASLGTIVISCIIVLRFFDTAYGFYVRGLIFITVGMLFLLSNIFISKKIRKAVQNVEHH